MKLSLTKLFLLGASSGYYIALVCRKSLKFSFLGCASLLCPKKFSNDGNTMSFHWDTDNAMG